MTQQERFKHLVNFTIDELTTYLIKTFIWILQKLWILFILQRHLNFCRTNGLDFMTKSRLCVSFAQA